MAFGAKVASIEFARDEVRVAVVRAGGRLPEILETAAVPVACENPDDRPAALAAALDEALNALRQRPAAYVLCVESARATVRNLRVPFRGAARVAKSVPFELEPHLPFPLEEIAVDHLVIGEAGGETDVLAVGIRRRHLEEYTAVLDAAGVDVESVSLDVSGLTALWHHARRARGGLEAVLHLREEGACLAVVSGRTLAFFRHIPIGAAEFLEDPARMAREARNTLRAFLAKWRGGDAEIAELGLTGAEPAPETLDAFSAALGMPVSPVCLLGGLRGGAPVLQRDGDLARFNRWEAVVGAGACAARGEFAFDLGRTERGWEGTVAGMVSHLLFSSCLALALVLGWAFYYHQTTTATRALTEQLRAKTAEIRAETETLSTQGLGEDVDITPFADPPLLDIMKEIGARMPETLVTVTEIKVAPPGSRGAWVTIAGETPSAEQFNTMFEELKKSAVFKVAEDASIRLQGDRTTFRIRAFRPNQEIEDEAQP